MSHETACETTSLPMSPCLFLTLTLSVVEPGYIRGSWAGPEVDKSDVFFDMGN